CREPGAALPEGDRGGRQALAPAASERRTHQLERRRERADERFAERLTDYTHEPDLRSLLVGCERDVEPDVALQILEQRQRHAERNAELLREQRVAFRAAQVELEELQGSGRVVPALAEARLGGHRQAPARDAVGRVGCRVRIERLEGDVLAVHLDLAARGREAARDEELSTRRRAGLQ